MRLWMHQHNILFDGEDSWILTKLKSYSTLISILNLDENYDANDVLNLLIPFGTLAKIEVLDLCFSVSLHKSVNYIVQPAFSK